MYTHTSQDSNPSSISSFTSHTMLSKMMKTIVVGVGGPTSSGKTTLAKHLLALLPSKVGVILHQDDFALPEECLPWNETLQAKDWDNPIGTIDYKRMKDVLHHAKIHGSLPDHHSSHDHLNMQPERPLDVPLANECRIRLANSLKRHPEIQHIIFADGFLLYYDVDVRKQMDIRLFLRCDRTTLENRRNDRGGYATAEGTVWQDPPGYFEHVIWPGYVEAHKRLFVKGDIEYGPLVNVKEDQATDGAPVKDLLLIEGQNTHINDVVKSSVNEIVRFLDALPSATQ